MNKETNKLIPDLRFHEFVNDGEWVNRSIDSVGDVVTGSTPSKEDKEYWGGEFVWVTAQDFKEKYIFNSVLKLTQKGKDKSRVIPVNSVLVTCIASIGLNGINKVECATNQQINSVICNSQNHFEFIYYAISHNNIRLKNMAGQTAVPIISKSVFEKFTIQTPQTHKEQLKIASCLSSLDEVIANHNQKLATLKLHKKGLMQNLFPQEGETVPKYRFPEFVNDVEWEQRSIIDTADKKVKWSFTGGPFGSNLKASDYTSKGIRIIQLQNIGDGEFNDDYKIYTSEEKANELLSCNIYSGEIIISKMGDPVGRACIIPSFLNRCVMASDGIRLVVDEKKYSKYFIYSLINSKRIREAIEKKATGSTRKRIGLDELRGIELIIPKELDEQQKIAECLSSLDALIKEQEERIEQLKLHKKGLMQGLFPKSN
ncbi:MAG: restriction endonuclease subunit S [Candidatus Kapaibacterium sp.]